MRCDEPGTVVVMPTFSPDIVTAVLAHMNGDHPEDNLLISRAFGDPEATSATMISLDGAGASWSYTVGGHSDSVTVPWSGPITERAEIRREVVVMYDKACEKLGLAPRDH